CLHARPCHGRMHAQAYGLGKGFLGGETRCKVTDSTTRVTAETTMEDFNLGRTEYAAYEPFGMAVEDPLDPVELKDVQPYSRNTGAVGLREHAVSPHSKNQACIIPWRMMQARMGGWRFVSGGACR